MAEKSIGELFNVEINHPFISLHYVAQNVPIQKAAEVAKKYSKILGSKTVFIEKIIQKGETTVHVSVSYYDFISKGEVL
jgi:hypothetical protein